MFSPWDEHEYLCECSECLERKRKHAEMTKSMTWQDYSASITITAENLKHLRRLRDAKHVKKDTLDTDE